MPEDIMRMLSAPTIDVVMAGRLMGVSRNSAYKAARDGSLPVIKIAGQYRVPTARLREMLGLTQREATAA